VKSHEKFIPLDDRCVPPFSVSTVSVAAPPWHWEPAASVEIPQSSGQIRFSADQLERQRLLAAHEKDGTSDFIDLRKPALISRLKVGAAVDTAMDPESTFYYVSVQEEERVAVVDAATLKEVNSIRWRGRPTPSSMSRKNHMVYVTHDEGADVWVIDPKRPRWLPRSPYPEFRIPEFMVYDESTDRIT